MEALEYVRHHDEIGQRKEPGDSFEAIDMKYGIHDRPAGWMNVMTRTIHSVPKTY
jgi:hypothetical protein